MAEDIKREGKFNQKRSHSIGVYGPSEAQILVGALVATLPERSVVESIKVNVTTASTTAGATLKIDINGVNIADVAIDAAGVIDGAVTETYYETGGDIEISPGGTAPAAGDFEGEVIVTYVELDRVTGLYTAN